MDNEICEARVGSSRHAAWVLHVIRFGLEPYPRTPRNRRAIIIGGSIAAHLKQVGPLPSWHIRKTCRRHGARDRGRSAARALVTPTAR
jgi:hypothetical protein